MTPDQPIDCADVPVLDAAYLDDMRGWVGDETLAALLADAPASIEAEVAAIRSHWLAGDLAAVRESGHRLKGAAGSIACRLLSLLGQKVQLIPDLGEATVLDDLDEVAVQSLTVLADYRAGLSA